MVIPDLPQPHYAFGSNHKDFTNKKGRFINSYFRRAFFSLIIYVKNLASFGRNKNLNLFFLFIFSLPIFAQTPPSGFSSVTLSSSYNGAVGLVFNKSGDLMFVWEKGGKVWVVQNNQKSLLIDISEEVGNWRDFGLLGFALHPEFEINGHFYLLYTMDRHHLLWYGTDKYNATANEYLNATIGRLTRYSAIKNGSDYSIVPNSRKILIGATISTGIPSLHTSHGVGSLVFGSDGTLLISTGDGASFSSVDGGSATETYFAQALADGIITSKENVGAFRAQLLESYNGKVLRIDPETGNGVPGNPFYESANPESVRSKVWALGLRNPFRMILKPGTGSTNPADGNPGHIYLGDVGYTAYEDLNVITKPGMNFGWPIFEGLTTHSGYNNLKTFNYYEPNTLYGVNGCSQEYFYFQDLIKQETASGKANFTNPCNTSQTIPTSIKTFIHSRPIIDWGHEITGPARTGTFNGETATVTNIGAADSPVSGPQFRGSAAIAGVFYTHQDFPAEYQNTLFFGDYGRRWIRNITLNSLEKPIEVKDFINSGSVVVSMTIHPTEGGLYYINYPSEIKKVTYDHANLPPLAVASSNKNYGPSPLTVQFTGSASSDPEGQPLIYLWDFGNGSTSIQANPTFTFNTPTNSPIKYEVLLTVTDSQGNSDKASLVVSVNNTPPQVTISSPADNTKYPLKSGEISYPLKATVSDQEHSNNQLIYQWQTILHHNDHEHPEDIDTSPETTTTISPLGCGEETYYYRITLTVSDPAGLSTIKEVKLYPDCSITPIPIIREYWANVSGNTVADIPVNSPPTSTSQLNLFEAPTNVADNYGTRIRAYVQTPISGDHIFWIASDDNSELWLSTDANPANKRKIAWVNNWTRRREWNKYASQKSIPVTLNAGQKYYIEALQKEGIGGDNLAVGWQLPDGHLEQPIPGLRLSPYEASSNQPPIANAGPDKTITLPINSVTLNGSGTDNDGTIRSYSWSKISGPAATLSGMNSKDLTASNLVAGTYIFQLTVTDNNGAAAVDEATVTVKASETTPITAGKISREYWANVSGNSVAEIPVNTPPTSTSELTLFEAPRHIADHYGTRIRGYVQTPISGDHFFWIASDDDGELWLSTDANPANKRKIAWVNGWTYSREWNRFPSQVSAKITLQAGQKYYIEALQKEGIGGDNLAVGWQLPNGTLERPIPGNRLYPYLDMSYNKVSNLLLKNLEQSDLQDQIFVYPNPFSGYAVISFYIQDEGNYMINLFDSKGALLKLLKEGQANNSFLMEFEIDLKDLPDGLYMLKLNTQAGYRMTKIMLEK